MLRGIDSEHQQPNVQDPIQDESIGSGGNFEDDHELHKIINEIIGINDVGDMTSKTRNV
jgi:hypothetical protein